MKQVEEEHEYHRARKKRKQKPSHSKQVSDSQLDYSDIPPSTDAELKRARRVGLKRPVLPKKKPGKSAKTSFVQHKPSSSKVLLNKKLVKQVLRDAFSKKDIDTYQDVLLGHLRTSLKGTRSKKTCLDIIGMIFKELKT